MGLLLSCATPRPAPPQPLPVQPVTAVQCLTRRPPTMLPVKVRSRSEGCPDAVCLDDASALNDAQNVAALAEWAGEAWAACALRKAP